MHIIASIYKHSRAIAIQSTQLSFYIIQHGSRQRQAIIRLRSEMHAIINAYRCLKVITIKLA